MNRIRSIREAFDPAVDADPFDQHLSPRGTPVSGTDAGFVYKHGPQTCRKCKRRNSGGRRSRCTGGTARSKFQKLLMANAAGDDIYGGLDFSLPTIAAEKNMEAAMAQSSTTGHLATASAQSAHARPAGSVYAPMRQTATVSPPSSTRDFSAVSMSSLPDVGYRSSTANASGKDRTSRALAAVQEISTPPLSSSISASSIVGATPANLLNSWFKTRSS